MLNNEYKIGSAIGSVFRERRRNLGLTLQEAGGYLSNYWHIRPHTANQFIGQLEFNGGWMEISQPNFYSEITVRTLKVRLSDYVSALSLRQDILRMMEMGYQKADQSFVFEKSQVPSIPCRRKNPSAKLRQLEKMLR
jgi:hypothetical protein